MDVGGLPIFEMIRGRLGWLSERQRVIAQNVANSDTPGYAARDLRAPSSFDAAMRGQTAAVGLTQTRAGHIAPPTAASRHAVTRAPDSETTLDGNSVVVEEQMLKLAESRMAYDAAISLYQKSLNMIRTAARPPGR